MKTKKTKHGAIVAQVSGFIPENLYLKLEEECNKKLCGVSFILREMFELRYGEKPLTNNTIDESIIREIKEQEAREAADQEL